MNVFCLGFLLGVCLAVNFLQFVFIFLAVSIVASLALYLLKAQCHWFWLLLGIVAALVWVFSYLQWQQSHIHPLLSPEVVTVQGTVASMPKSSSHRLSFAFAIEKVWRQQHWQTRRQNVQLSWYADYPPLHIGDRWQLYVKLKPVHALANPGSQRNELWFIAHGIAAQGYVRQSGENHFLSVNHYAYWLTRWRQHLALRIKHLLGNRDTVGIVNALAVGLRDDMTAQQWQVFRNTGTNHLIAISGLHVSLVAGLVLFLMQFVWRRLARLCRLIAAQRASTLR